MLQEYVEPSLEGFVADLTNRVVAAAYVGRSKDAGRGRAILVWSTSADVQICFRTTPVRSNSVGAFGAWAMSR